MERVVIDTSNELTQDPAWIRIPLDQRWLLRLDAFVKQDASIRCAFECLNRFLTAGGIHVRKKFWKASDYFNGILNTTYARLCRDIVPSELTYGLVIIGLREDAAPFVYDLTDLSITIMVHQKTNAYRYRILPLRDQQSTQPLKEIMAFELSRPDSMGRVTSTISTLWQMHEFSNLMIACASRSEVRRSVPPLITEAREIKLEEKQFGRDMFEMGDNTAIHRRQIADSTIYSVAMAEERELQSRMSQSVLGSRGASLDPVTYQRRYQVDLAAGMTIPIPIEEGRTLVTNTPSASPEFLLELLSLYEADVGKVLGVPIGLWGSARSPVAVDMTIMTVFNASLQVRRQHLQYALHDVLEWVYGDENAAHAALHYDASLSLEDNAAAMNWDISFPGLLDPEQINMLIEQGYMEYEQMRPYVSAYYGIPESCLAKKRLDPMTGRSLAEVSEEQLKLEHTQIKTGIQEQKAKTVALGGRLSDRKAPSKTGPKAGKTAAKKTTRDRQTSEKSQATKKKNLESRKLSKEPKLRA